MLAITHNEVRRHPRWREQVSAPQESSAGRFGRVHLLGMVAVLIISTAIGVLIFS